MRSARVGLYRAAEIDEDRLLQFIGPPLIGSFETLCSLTPADARRAVGHYRERYAETGIFENSVYPGVCDLLEELWRKERNLVLATSKPTVYAERILRHFGLLDYFQMVMGSELDGTRTCKTEVIRTVLDIMQPDVTKTIMIGDREHDILGARQNRIAGIGVTYGYGTQIELQAAKPDHLVNSPEELGRLLCGR